MNVHFLAERKAKALIKIQEVAGPLSEKFSIPDELLARLTQSSKDKDVEAMQRMEAVADLLVFLAEKKEVTESKPSKPEVPFILDQNVKKVCEAVEGITSVPVLKELLKQESEDQVRKTVISAIEARIDTLKES